MHLCWPCIPHHRGHHARVDGKPEAEVMYWVTSSAVMHHKQTFLILPVGLVTLAGRKSM